MTEEEQKLFRLYGKLPNKKDLLQNKLKVGLLLHSLTPSYHTHIYVFARNVNISIQGTMPFPKPVKPPTVASPPLEVSTRFQKIFHT